MSKKDAYKQKMKAAKGFILGLVAAVSYGTNPMFALPLYAVGLTVSSVLFYRYAFASVILAVIMLIKGTSFRLTFSEAVAMLGMGVLFALSSVFLFMAYNYMDVGLASTLLFVEPVFIALILWLVFHEHIKLSVLLSIGVCLGGVVCLCNPGEGAYVTTTGIVLVMASALSYAIYMVAINKSRARHLSGMSITFYSLLFGQVVFMVTTRCFTEVQSLAGADLRTIGCITGLAVVPTIISLLTVAISVKYVGSVTVAILGAFEPVTGIVIGCLLFDEILTPRGILGVVLILLSVIMITLSHRSKT